MKRSSKALVILGALLLWYAIIGFWIAPTLIRHFGEAQLQKNFSPESAIAKVRINPFTGSFRVEGLKLGDTAGAWSAAWQEAEINVSAATLIKFYPVVDAVRLVGADVRYELASSVAAVEDTSESETETSGDWRDLIDQLNEADIPKVRVDLLEVVGGRVEFIDQTETGTYRKTVDPIDFTLRDFTTVVEGDMAMRFIAETEAGATLAWEGDFRSQPIRSSGTFALSGLAIEDLSPYYTRFTRFTLKRAVFGFGFDYQLDLSDIEDLFQIQNGHLALTEVLCEPIEQDDRLISIDSVSAEGIGFRFPAMALDVPEVQIRTGETRIFRAADGQINLAQLIALPAPSEPPVVEAPPVESSLPALSYRIGRIALTDYRIVWEEVLDEGSANLTVDIPRMEISGISSDLESPFQLVADYEVGPSGTAHIEGSIVPAAPSLDLSVQVTNVPLELLSPYAEKFGKARIEKGTFDFDGRIQYAAEGAQTLSGDAAVSGIAFVYDRNLTANWLALDLKGLRLDISPFALAMESVALEQPEVVFTQTGGSGGGEKPAETATVEPGTEQQNSSPGSPIRIDAFKVSDGHFTYIDDTMEPAPRIEMDALSLDLSGLNLAGSQPAELALSTQINGSTFKVNGALNFSRPKEATRLKASLSDLSLPAFSPYSGQAVGRGIASGSFSLESDWEVLANQLNASNQIRIEQLKLGDSVQSENATSLPLDLAVTLLKGTNGVMDLSLPLSGDLSDPQVGVGQIVRTAIVGLITNVASAPFKILSGLVGAEEDLSVVSFDPGSSELSPSMTSRLNALATALKERPGLELVITPRISQVDEAKLAEEKLRIELLDGSDLSDEKLYRKRLTDRYQDFMKAAGTPDRETKADSAQGLETMLATLLPGVELKDTDRASLAAERVATIRDHLLTAQSIADQRVSVAEPEFGGGESAANFDLQ